MAKFKTAKSEADKQKEIIKDYIKRSLNYIKNLFFALIAALLIKTFLIETSRVPTGSMEKTILIGDFLFVNKFIYGTSSPRTIPFTNIRLPYFQLPALAEPKAKEIVVFEYPGDRDELKPEIVNNYVKRCIGVPGDTIEIKEKVVFINGKEFYRPTYIQYSDRYVLPDGMPDPNIFPKGFPWNKDNYGPLVIPKKGDVVNLTPENIEIYRTLIDRELERNAVTLNGREVQIDGINTREYEIKDDYYFMMGDNRDDSADSRYWGFVPRRLVLGETLMIYWSWDPSIPFSNFFELLGSVRLDRIGKLVH